MTTDQIVIEIIPADQAAPLAYEFLGMTEENAIAAKRRVKALKSDPMIEGARMFGQTAAQVASIKEMLAH